MSEEGNDSSFGNSKPQPPSPKQTPTSAAFPTSVFETPKNDRDGPWSPKFAEEYSVFNSTPGNLRGGHGLFPNFSAPSPYQGTARDKRPLSLELAAARVASHTNHFSPNQDTPLPPVDPSRRLSSSPAGLLTGSKAFEPGTPTGLPHRSAKKSRRNSSQRGEGLQIATPPPSTHKGERRLAPRPQDEVMQDDHLYPHDFVAGTPSQQNMGSFTMTSPTDMFGFPLAPSTAPAFTEARSFWDTDMSGMEMDFSMADASMFQAAAAASQRPMDTMDWGTSAEMFQTQGMAPQQNQENRPPQNPSKKGRLLAPKPVATDIASTSADVASLAGSFPVGSSDPFAMMGPGAVDPGLLLTRPPSSGMIPAAYDQMGHVPLLGQPMFQADSAQPTFQQPLQGELRRSASSKDVGSRKGERVAGVSPAKGLGRPGLSRSMSENRGKKTLGRSATLPTLAPAARSMAPPQPQIHQQPPNRPMAQNSRNGGRISPLKHNRRLSSLASIPESASQRTRTQVKFTIDSRGRARAETTTVVVGGRGNNDNGPRARKNRSPTKSWASGDDDSSSDDEPIIIPSRNSSFVMPEHSRPSSANTVYHSSRRSISDSSTTSSLGIYFNESQQQQDVGEESDAETVLNVPSASRIVGDAASELRKVVEGRQKSMSINTSHSFMSSAPYNASAISPTKNDDGLPTPSSDRGSHVRCICNSTQSRINGDAYMVQCESCEMYLHGKCINITRQTHPKVYICAYCLNAPSAQGGSLRIPRKSNSSNPSGSRTVSSPLAHKSFKFR